MTMTAAQLEQHQATEDEVIDWRFEQLREAGYERRQARLLSQRRYVDLHQAIELVQRGCTHDLAFAILV
jgi:hypothetical protein